MKKVEKDLKEKRFKGQKFLDEQMLRLCTEFSLYEMSALPTKQGMYEGLDKAWRTMVSELEADDKFFKTVDKEAFSKQVMMMEREIVPTFEHQVWLRSQLDMRESSSLPKEEKTQASKNS